MTKKPNKCCTLLYTILLFTSPFVLAKSFLTIGTGGVTGVYYPTGGAICKMVNKNASKHSIKCNVQSTGGSVYNANSLRASNMDMGIIQSDVGFNSWNGSANFKSKDTNLRSVLSLHSESLTLVVRKDSGIKDFKKLHGKRVNIGNPGSGTRRTVEDLFKSCSIDQTKLKLAATLKPAEMPDALRDGKIDAYFYVVGHPTANVKDISTHTDIAILPLQGPCVNKLVSEKPYFAKSVIPGKLYRGVDQDVPSFGVKATLLSSEKVSAETTYETVKAIIEGLDAFKKLHPSFSTLTEESLFEGLSAPLHKGTQKYLKEREAAASKKPIAANPHKGK